jgi:hypothetical protein
MRNSPTWLLSIEITSLLLWLLFAGFFLFEYYTDEGLQPISLEALETSSIEERWNGIFFQEQHVGYSVAKSTTADDGTMLLEQRSLFHVATFGQLQQIVTAGTALTNPKGQLQKFDFFFASDLAKISARGEVQSKKIVMEVNQNGEKDKLEIPILEPPHLGMTIEATIRKQELYVGKTLTVPYFDPVTLAQSQMNIRVTSTEILENGEEAWWLTSTYGDIQTRSLVSPTGDILRQEGALGLSMVRMTPEEAQNIPKTDEPVDLIALSAVTLKGKIKQARQQRDLKVRIKGVDSTKILSDPPLQSIEKDIVTIAIPNPEDLPQFPISTDDPIKDLDYLLSSLTISSGHEEIISKAQEVTKGVQHRLEAVKKLNDFVFNHMQKFPSIGVPNGLQALRNATGDCNEHTVLFISLARALQIPSRIAVGLVYSDRSGPVKGFYYHAWAEVRFGDVWLPIEPTFGQIPADATHIKVANGELDKQIEIMGLLGKISLELVETPSPPKIVNEIKETTP